MPPINEEGPIGITSTIPIEIPMAAGVKIVDMNNSFITSPSPKMFIQTAERCGLSYNLCGWVKGLFSIGASGIYDRIVVVDSGDCTDLVALSDFWREEGIEVIFFNYPSSRSREAMEFALDQFSRQFGVTLDDARAMKAELDLFRRKLFELDRLTWEEGKVSGLENHLYLVQASDFGSDLELFERGVDRFLEEANDREKGYNDEKGGSPRLGFVGVPPIITDFYQNVEELGGVVVYNETQHQFSMPFDTDDLTEQYLSYTYPYGGKARWEFIEKEIERRKLDGIIFYSENFCYKSIVNTYIRTHLKIPSIEVEGKSPEPMDARTRMRLEAFIEMLRSDY